MPPINSRKIYVENGYYHVYNRGVEKRDIFLDQQDYVVFLRFLKEYLLPPKHPDLISLQSLTPRRKPINCYSQISLLAYCLMPNHFHLFLKQTTLSGLKVFMQAIGTNYSMYFNHKYKRVGTLFQGVYKAVLIDTEPYFIHITRYIHRNPLDLLGNISLEKYPYSSYRYYLSQKPPDWLDPKEILAMFRSGKSIIPKDFFSYESFVEYEKFNDEEILGRLRLED